MHHGFSLVESVDPAIRVLFRILNPKNDGKI